MQKRKNQSLRISILTLFILLPLSLSACGGVPKVEWELSITGNVNNPITFTFKELATMEQIALSDVYMEKSRGEDEVRSFSGVSLDLLIEKAAPSSDYSSITAKAADGYAIEISKDEMVDGIIAMKQAGEWIIDADPGAGPIRLVFPMTPANRWVFQVSEIIINP